MESPIFIAVFKQINDKASFFKCHTQSFVIINDFMGVRRMIAIYITVSLSIGSILGLVVKNQAKLTMIAQLVFLPSIMLSGIMFPIDLLPGFLETIGCMFPAFWGYRLMLDHGFCLENLWYFILVFCGAVMICAILLNRQKSK